MNLQMGEYVVMPNHFHAIIIIGENQYNSNQIDAPNQFGPQSKNLASIIRGFKSGVTINARKIHANFSWQARFHDHVIRDDDEYLRIASYIASNVMNWPDDKLNQQ